MQKRRYVFGSSIKNEIKDNGTATREGGRDRVSAVMRARDPITIRTLRRSRRRGMYIAVDSPM